MSGTLAALHAITSGEACPAYRKTSPGKVFRGQEPARYASSAAIGPYRRQGDCKSARVAATLHYSDHSIWGIPVSYAQPPARKKSGFLGKVFAGGLAADQKVISGPLAQRATVAGCGMRRNSKKSFGKRQSKRVEETRAAISPSMSRDDGAIKGPSDKLAVFRTVGNSYRFLFENLSSFVRLAALPFVVWMAGMVLFEWYESKGNSTYFNLFADIVYAWFSLFWHRLYLLGPDRAKATIAGNIVDPEGRGTKIMRRFLIRSIVYVGSLYMILTVWGIIIGIGAGFALGSADAALGVIILSFALLYYPLSGVFLRFLPLFPATAVGRIDFRIGDAWRSTRGNSMRLATVLLLSSLPLVVILLLVTFVLAGFDTVIQSDDFVLSAISLAPQGAIMFALVAVMSACSANAYRDLVGIE